MAPGVPPLGNLFLYGLFVVVGVAGEVADCEEESDHGKKFALVPMYNKSTPYVLVVCICQNKSVHGLGLGLFMKCQLFSLVKRETPFWTAAFSGFHIAS